MRKPLRLLFVTNFYPPHDLGGFEQWCHEVAGGLAALGHDVRVLTSRHGLAPGAPTEPGVTRALHLQADIHHYEPLHFLLHATAEEEANRRAVRQSVEASRPDVAVIWGMWNLSRGVAREVEWQMGARTAYYIASYWPTDPDIHRTYWEAPTRRPLMRLVKAPLAREARRRLAVVGEPRALDFRHAACCSAYVRGALVEQGPLRPAARVLFGGIDPTPFVAHPADRSASASPLKLLYFGGLYEHKGVHLAIEAVGALARAGLGERVRLTILGGGQPDYVARLHADIARHGVGHLVAFADRVPRAEIPAILGRYDVSLFTSTWPEPMARAVMEAMAAGMVVVGARVGGQTEMMRHGENALTFEPGDAQDLALGIRTILDEPELGPRLAEAGRATILEHFTLDRMVADMDRWLHEIAAGEAVWEAIPKGGITRLA